MSDADKPLRVAAYARTSLVLQQDPSLQLVAIREYAQRQGYQITQEYIDQMSGLKSKRPGLESLLSDCKHKKIDLVMITALDRLGRSTKNMLELLEIFKEHKVGLVSLREQINLNSASGIAFFTICSAIAQLDRDQIAERIRVALQSKKIIAQQTV